MDEMSLEKSSGLLEYVSTVNVMIKIYCNENHGTDELCDECFELTKYAEFKVMNCVFGVDKPVCNKCTVHCYKPSMREKIIKVMRYSGPKMAHRYPTKLSRH